MKFGICNETFEGWELAPAAQAAAEAGYDGLEIAPFTLWDDAREATEDDAAAAGRVVRDAGLEVIGFHWLLAGPAGLHLTSTDPAVRKTTTDYLVHLARLCGAAGGQVMVFGSPQQRRLEEGEPYETALEWAIAACREVARAADAAGVVLAIEPLGPEEDDLLPSTERAAELIEAVGHPACRLHLDVKALYAQGEEPTDVIPFHASELAHFHANDANRRGPGFGDVDFVPIFRALREAEYDKYVSVEVFDYTPDPVTIARRSIAYLRECRAQVE